MKCKKCGKDTEVSDTRALITEDNVSFVRRIRYCCKKHQSITHEIYADQSSIPDIYRMKRIRKPAKKTKPKKKDQWLKNIISKLDS